MFDAYNHKPFTFVFDYVFGWIRMILLCDDENILTIIRATRAPRGIFFGLDICIFYLNPIRKLC
jgi:hypothetical protein